MWSPGQEDGEGFCDPPVSSVLEEAQDPEGSPLVPLLLVRPLHATSGHALVSRGEIREVKKPLSVTAGAIGFQLLPGLVCPSIGAFNNADKRLLAY